MVSDASVAYAEWEASPAGQQVIAMLGASERKLVSDVFKIGYLHAIIAVNDAIKIKFPSEGTLPVRA